MRKIAVPVLDGKFSPHFGGSKAFMIFNTEGNEIVSRDEISAPRHEHGAFPAWLARHEVTDVIAGGMGKRAMNMFIAYNIEMYCGVESGEPEELVRALLAGNLKTSNEPCTDHGYHGHHGEHQHDH